MNEATKVNPGSVSRIHRRRRLAVLVSALAVLSLAAAGCGGDDDSTTGAQSRSPEEIEAAQQKQRETVESFGLEASQSQAKRAEAALQGYLNARANGEWQKACSYQTKVLRRLYGRAAQSEDAKSKGCAGFMETATRKLPASERAGINKIDVNSVRVDDAGRGFILYTNATGDEYAMSIGREEGDWKVTGDLGTPLN